MNAAPAIAAPEPVLAIERSGEAAGERRRYELEDTGFNEVPKRFRRFYRRWGGPGEVLAPNEVLCPVCKVVIRSTRELRPGDHVFCLPCMSKLVVVRAADGSLAATSPH
ncbi:MAG TPA: hypothetical protein VGK20_11380 [Candidatus Binatia bacterium]